jgi:hypothetical protein
MLVGLRSIGIVGLRDALRKAIEARLSGREEIIDFIV